MSDKKTVLNNEIVDEKVKIVTDATGSFGVLYPAATVTTLISHVGVNFVEMGLYEARTKLDYDLVGLRDGMLAPNVAFDRKTSIVNYEMGKVRLTIAGARNLIETLQALLDSDVEK